MAEAATIHVDIVSAEGEIFSGAGDEVFAPASQGELGIYPRHAPLLTLLKAGEVRVQTRRRASEQFFYVGGGALEVQPTQGHGAGRHGAARQGSRRGAAALAAKQRAEEALKDARGEDHAGRGARRARSRVAASCKMLERLRKLRG